MASYPALDLRYVVTADSDALPDLIYAALDDLEPVAIEGDAGGETLRVFFRSGAARDHALAALGATFGTRLLDISPVEVDDGDWARRSQANLTAVRAGRIVVAPPWDPLAAHDNAQLPTPKSQLPIPNAQLPTPNSRALVGDETDADVVIVIEPSMGFGTGHHATTRLCLELLQTLALGGRRVIDVGTGSGVLAIAATKLGASAVVALDNDPDALQNARENAAANGVADIVGLREADLSAIDIPPADIVLANLTGAVLERFAPVLRSLVTPGGTLVVSGFSPAELPGVVTTLGARVVRDRQDGEWCAAVIDVH